MYAVIPTALNRSVARERNQFYFKNRKKYFPIIRNIKIAQINIIVKISLISNKK